ncbi:MFS transporter [Sporosarcina highlanderae]|uniref:MFS transporter n=1 Tax=Sporosarcina highlanderae TaxID=3035916 RepID=A0ABT8JRU0_9BACL|nr:MFS transporter [Sporosarcina highlanderae]MDN4607737.1 MFS transporter [Sporosarcina highlanderae]
MRTYNEKISIYHGMASTIAVNFSGNFFPIFAITILGATNYQVGLISSLPPLMALLMTIPAAILLNRAQTQKKLVAVSVLLARMMFLLIIALVFIPSKPTQAWMFLVIIALMNLPNTVANVGWQTFISGLVPESNRGTFFSDRNRLLTVVGLFSTLLIGILMKDASENVIAYQVLFGIAFFFGLLEVFLLMKHDEQPAKMDETSLRKKTMDWSIFKYKNYVSFLVAALFFNFAWQMAWGIFNIYHVRVVGVTIFWISMFSVGSMLAQIISFPLWKKWAEKKSNTLVFVWAAVGMATTPFLTVLSTNLFYITIIQTSSGFFLAGVVLLLFNLLLEQSPAEVRTYCITTYNVLLSVVAFIAPQIGIWLLNSHGVESAMYINSILRFLSACLFFVVYLKYARKPGITI